MQAAVMDPVTTDPIPLDLPAIFYPDFELSPPEPSSADSVPAFTVDTLAKTDWAVAKILDAEARNARRAELAAQLHARIDLWLTKASSSDQDTITYLTSLLRPFVESEIAKQRRSRTLLLPSGSASLRKLPDRLDILDREAALAYCQASHPEAVVVKMDLSMSVLRTIIFKENQPIPGVDAELGRDDLVIRSSL
jgi:hypothetical protein